MLTCHRWTPNTLMATGFFFCFSPTQHLTLFTSARDRHGRETRVSQRTEKASNRNRNHNHCHTTCAGIPCRTVDDVWYSPSSSASVYALLIRASRLLHGSAARRVEYKTSKFRKKINPEPLRGSDHAKRTERFFIVYLFYTSNHQSVDRRSYLSRTRVHLSRTVKQRHVHARVYVTSLNLLCIHI